MKKNSGIILFAALALILAGSLVYSILTPDNLDTPLAPQSKARDLVETVSADKNSSEELPLSQKNIGGTTGVSTEGARPDRSEGQAPTQSQVQSPDPPKTAEIGKETTDLLDKIENALEKALKK